VSGGLRPLPAPAGEPGPAAGGHAGREAEIKARARLEFAAQTLIGLVRAVEWRQGRAARDGRLMVEVGLADGGVEAWEIIARRRRPGAAP